MHLFTCLWILAASFDADKNWIEFYRTRTISTKLNSNNLKFPSSDVELYLTSLYFVVTTMTTVGYGDISQVNIVERILGIVILLVVSVSFAFCSGAMASIFTN